MTSHLEESPAASPPQFRRNGATVVQVACAVVALALGFALAVFLATLAGNPNSASSQPPVTTGQASRSAQ